MTISSGIWYFAAIHNAPAVAFVGQRDAERGPDLRPCAKLAPRMAVGPVEIPQFSRPPVQCPCAEHPVFVFDRPPHLECQAGYGHRDLVPALLGLFTPLCP